jgi:hypothetical protein
MVSFGGFSEERSDLSCNNCKLDKFYSNHQSNDPGFLFDLLNQSDVHFILNPRLPAVKAEYRSARADQESPKGFKF